MTIAPVSFFFTDRIRFDRTITSVKSLKPLEIQQIPRSLE